ncbi:hypothetical protein PR048_014831 [Dryococelus australis]|uniref:DDE-1 domain-containing protein n=1 Tax=Dryococelus australis TaxID=614101 RepID=A0ABQ9HF93_9NEOP|nr:hypothetical protein PR048_014831 [Dryococelus australis]
MGNKLRLSWNRYKLIAAMDAVLKDAMSIREANLNPARAQKFKRFIAGDHFDKLLAVMTELDVLQKPQSIYDKDEKGTQHGENVTIVACGNALGNVIPSVILFKGDRMKPEWRENLPPGSNVFMTPKASMTSQTFIKWLDYFAKFKSPGPVLLIFDGAQSRLDANIVTAAEAHGVTLYCLPSNTTHKLQPLDKSLFIPFESYWDNEVMLFWARKSSSKEVRVNKVGHPFHNIHINPNSKKDYKVKHT